MKEILSIVVLFIYATSAKSQHNIYAETANYSNELGIYNYSLQLDKRIHSENNTKEVPVSSAAKNITQIIIDSEKPHKIDQFEPITSNMTLYDALKEIFGTAPANITIPTEEKSASEINGAAHPVTMQSSDLDAINVTGIEFPNRVGNPVIATLQGPGR